MVNLYLFKDLEIIAFEMSYFESVMLGKWRLPLLLIV